MAFPQRRGFGRSTFATTLTPAQTFKPWFVSQVDVRMTLQKNVASQVIPFALVNATTGAALTGATVTTVVSKDGTQAAGGGTVTELGGGQYKYVPTQAETNVTSLGVVFTATNAVPKDLALYTIGQDPTAAQLAANTTQLAGQTVTAAAGVTFPSSVASPTNLTAGTLTTVTTATNVTTVNGLAANVITAASINADAITDAKVAADVTIASVTGAVGSVTGAVGSVTGAVGSVTGAVGSVTGAVGSVTGNVGGNVTGSVGSLAAQAKADVNAEVVDAVSVDVIADSIPADGSRPTIAQALYLLTQFMLERSVSVTTVTVKKPDGATTLFTLTLNDAATPTSITRAT